MKLYAHECCECGIAMSYSLLPDVQAEAMCNGCATAFVHVARALEVPVVDEHNAPLTPNRIIRRKWNNNADYEYRTRVRIIQWYKYYATDKEAARNACEEVDVFGCQSMQGI